MEVISLEDVSKDEQFKRAMIWMKEYYKNPGGIIEELDSINGNEKSIRIFETRVPGTGRDGGPNCATVKPFAGWKSKN